MASREHRVFWTTPTHRYVLWRIDGVLEVRLYAGHRVIALETCRDDDQAQALAEAWRDRPPAVGQAGT